MNDLGAIAARFSLDGKLLSAEPWGNGHIHDTYRLTCDGARYILQRINHQIFKEPLALMENMARVTRHLQQQQGGRSVRLVAARDGQSFGRDEQGNYWRMFHFVEGTRSVEAVESTEQAYEAAAAFGRFLVWMMDLPLPRLHEVIPHFHNTLRRHAALEKAIEADVCGRVAVAETEIKFALKHERDVSALLATPLPVRITHNDCKLNNVLFDGATGVGVCVVDLDTVMHASLLYDFGDLVRATSCRAAEDERDLSRVALDLELFEALARGYFAEAGHLFTAEERQMLVVAGKLITYETGIRFLTDFLCGDTYFKVHREGHNLDRCRTQFHLVESIERQMTQMEQVVAVL
jgi:Ser/Thr protein kinase RdoA (MazF antagonist)